MKEKILIVVRHAHRDVIDPSEDNGLSEKGQKQAMAIKSFYIKNFDSKEIKLFSSPKLRCQETLEPLSKYLNVKMEILDLLDESSQTKGGRIEERIMKFKTWWFKEAPPLMMICSHGDWIPTFFEQTLNQSTALKKGGWAELKLRSGKVSLEKLVQRWNIEF
ncbi:MAG: hypothetical protein JWQ35_555 [Bacteriovoracaceae bacterium]|nr:hypothetical protein [Bacteriovoracaceae bacterium]